MRPLRLQLSGRYWDAFLYDGVLYAFTLDGKLERYRWDSLIRAIPWGQSLSPVAWHLLARGRMWYSTTMQQLLRSPTFSQFLQSQIEILSSRKWTVSRTFMAKFLIDAEDAPNFPHSDVEAYYNQLFVASPAGIYQETLAKRGSGGFTQVTDLPSLRISAGYSALGIAAGADGLWEHSVLDLGPRGVRDAQGLLLSEASCHACSWARFDLVGSGIDGRSVIAAFTKPARRTTAGTFVPDEYEDLDHAFLETIDGQAILGESKFAFAAGDQLFSLAEGNVTAVTWNPYKRRAGFGADPSQANLGRRSQRVPNSVQGEVLDAVGTIFGIVIETQQRLTVLASDGSTAHFTEPTNWRAFPRSTRYVNQLHVVNSQGIQVNAYAHDYFIESKLRQFAATRPNSSVAEN